MTAARPGRESKSESLVVARPREDAPTTWRILGVDVLDSSRQAIMSELLERLASRRRTAVAFANANLLTYAAKDPGLRRALGGMLVLNDGVAVDAACRYLYGRTFSENLNGTDFTPALLAALPKGTRVFLYGARPHVVAKLAKQMDAAGQVTVCGWQDGYASSETLAERIEAARTDVVLVALGNPRQELWIDANRAAISAPLMIGVGAFFDFAAGEVPRAPALMRKLRCEWLFRLAIEPRRLWRRYSVEGIEFFRLVRKQAREQRR